MRGAPYRLLLACLLLLVPGCQREETGDGPDAPPRAVATVGMLADVVRNVVGDRMQVDQIIPSGVDPHLYNPTRSALLKIERADILFFNGLMLEGRMASVLNGQRKRGLPFWPVADRILEAGRYPIIKPSEHHDPHLWMDVGGWMEATRIVTDALAEHDPEGADAYRSAAADYLDELEELDAYARNSVSTIPERQRLLVTAHDAFGYMGRAYGLEVRGIQGLSTESEAGIRDIEELVDLLVERRIPAVFVETSVSDKNVSALREGAADRGHELRIGGRLFSDAMGKPGTYEGTYIGMIDHNVTTIVRSLGGDAPARGLHGRLPAPDPR